MLYYLHDVSGSVLQAINVVRELADAFDVIGFQAFGLSWDCQPDPTVEEMAARYLTVLLDRDPDGPYRLVGYSMGALVAFEMAAQLGRQGASVSRLVMIDPSPPTAIEVPSKVAVVAAMARSMGLPDFTAPDTDDLDDVLLNVVRQAVDAGLLPADYSVDDLRPSMAVRWCNAHAAARYRPQSRIAGRISIVSARAERLPTQVDGWAAHTSDRVDGHLVDSDHFSLVGPAYAPAVATTIRRWLAEP